MPLSNYVASSRISQPGVCTSSTRPSSPYEGQVIYETDTNRVLVYDASAWVMIADTDQPPGLQLIKTQTFSSTGSVDVMQCFTSEFDFYEITIMFTSASSYLYFQLINGTTPTVRNGASYVAAGFQVAYDGSLATSNDSLITSYRISPNNLNNQAMFTMEFRYNNSGQSMWSSFGTTTANGVTIHKSGGYHATADHDGFRLLSGANMSGTVRVYGYRN